MQTNKAQANIVFLSGQVESLGLNKADRRFHISKGGKPAAELQAAVKKALHSAAFTKFMSQAVQAALAEAQGQPTSASIVLTPSPTIGLAFYDGGVACSYKVTSADGKSMVRMQRNYEDLDYPEHRHHWYGYESHTDARGRVWASRLPHMVQDDFGNLVEVHQ